jgi:hypothetical protein
MADSNKVTNLELALDVLQKFSIEKRAPGQAELLQLRELAREPFEKALADDELCCFIIHRELARRAQTSCSRPATRAA